MKKIRDWFIYEKIWFEMKDLRFKATFFTVLQSLLLSMILSLIVVNGQSTNVDYPTPVTTNSISGRIKARDIGDSRLTVHYYVFEGKQGDIFLKIEAANLNGDIDIFYADNLRPLTKISLYAESAPVQTGREIYLRKSERLILKVEGRTPNDDPATYSIKFEGSFQSVAANSVPKAPVIPQKTSENENENESGVKVNSVGTIIETAPKPTPTPKETVARNTSRRNTNATTPQPVTTIKPKTTTSKTAKKTDTIDENDEPKKPEVIVSENLPKTTETVKKETAAKPSSKSQPAKRTTTTTKKTTTAKKEPVPAKPKPNPAAELAKALENVRLVVEFKDGGKIERPMNDVLRFGVDKGILTIINKDGSIGRYSILDVVKITVE